MVRSKIEEAPMRSWPVVTILLLAGCAEGAPPVVYVASDWRTSGGEPLTVAEFAALKQACGPKAVALPLDRERQVATPARDNPAYHPGGEALANAPQTGIGAPDNPIRLAISRGHTMRLQPLEECLAEKGVARER
jgi:hypothetical protein